MGLLLQLAFTVICALVAAALLPGPLGGWLLMAVAALLPIALLVAAVRGALGLAKS
ncbi:MAG: hypothetical protein LCH79_07855 [Proteobacteria bacterium]|nr:hypothetical protein [Pseudomonadota bacterium]